MVTLILALLVGASLPANDRCDTDTGPSALRRAAAATQGLDPRPALPVPEVDAPDLAQPPQSRLEHVLADVIVELLNARPSASARTIARSVTTRLRRIAAEAGKAGDARVAPCGAVDGLEVHAVEGHPDLIVATAPGRPCDTGPLLDVFGRSGRRWRLLLEQQETGFTYAVSPTAADDSWYIVVAEIGSGPRSSSSRGLRYQVLRPVAGTTTPAVLLDRTEAVYDGAALAPKLTLERDRFRLSWVGRSIDSDAAARVHVVQFAVGRDSVERVPPYAVDARDFVEEWLTLPWSDAVRWTAPRARAVAERWHARLHGWNPAPDELAATRHGNGSPAQLFDVTTRCGNSGGWQVGLLIEGDGLPAELYFTVARDRDAFRIDSVGDRPAVACASAPEPERQLTKLP